MAQAKLYLDTRCLKKDGRAPLKIMLSQGRKTALLTMKIYILPEHWDGMRVTTANPSHRVINAIIGQQMAKIDCALYELYKDGREDCAFDEIKRLIKGDESKKDNNLLENYYRGYCERCRKAKTASIYLGALNKIKAFVGDEKFSRLRFEDISKDWLGKFQKWMLDQGISLNTCNIHFRSIRAVFNDAIDNDVTTNYPFRKFRMKTVRTAKRSLPVEDLRELFEFPCLPEQQKYLDMFKLIFMLIGINTVDLFNLNGIHRGRIEYTRSKTYRLYSIKVEPEALELINRYRGKSKLLDIADRYKNHEDYIRRLNRALKSIGPVTVLKHGKRVVAPLFPEISSYWARHSWATIAASLDIPKETIAAALGHGGNTVTDIYIDFDQRKVDEANRRVLDWVLYGKR